jgi:sterol-4alpha-carboxylate 3-dehydrogenase (decarboxylating)
MESKPVVEGRSFVVTGSSGLCGQRLVEMLVERGAKRVVAFDFAPVPEDAIKDARVTYIKGDICNKVRTRG